MDPFDPCLLNPSMIRLLDPRDERITATTRARFWARVDRRAADECWPWKGAMASKGYGRAFLDDMGRVLAHRLALLIDGRALTAACPDALHSCDNPICVNPAHLRAGHKLANAKDMVDRGRALTGDRAPFRAKPEACPRGEGHFNHVLTEKEVREIRRSFVPYITTIKALAETYGVTLGAISNIVYNRTWKHVGKDEPLPEPTPPEPPPKRKYYPESLSKWKGTFDGSRKTNQPLKDFEVAEIQRRVQAGFTMKEVARMFHIHPDTVSKVMKRKTD
jgi:plasmid maintenance system antidote protein VapI